MPPLFRASQGDQFFACPEFINLVTPEGNAKAQAEFNPKKAEWGSMVHHWKETGEFWHPSDDKNEIALFYERVKETDEKSTVLWPINGHHEASIAYNWLNDYAVVEFNVKDDNAWRDGFDKEWITGKCDYFRLANGTLWVDDLKTGQLWDKRPRECVQLAIYAIALNRAGYDCDYVRLTITHWPKYPKAPPVRYEGQIFEVDKLDGFRDRLYKLCKKQVINPSAENCRFCPARFDCQQFVWQ